MLGVQAIIERANEHAELTTSWEMTGQNYKIKNNYDHKISSRQGETTDLISCALQLSVFFVVGILRVQTVIDCLKYRVNSQQRMLQDPFQLLLPHRNSTTLSGLRTSSLEQIAGKLRSGTWGEDISYRSSPENTSHQLS